MIGAWLGLAMVAGGYLLGSIPFGIVVTRLLGLVDPRTVGSRNIGFTNVLRVAGKKAGGLTLAGDMGKGCAAGAVAAAVLDQEVWVLAVALAAVLGHVYPLFLGFHGGKGVATAMGAVLGVAPLVGFGLILVWLVSVGMWRYSSGGALAAFGALPVISALSGASGMFLGFSGLLAVIIFTTHRGNIVRLWQGIEPRIGEPRS